MATAVLGKSSRHGVTRRRVLRYYRVHIRVYGYAPTYKEVGDDFGMSDVAIWKHVSRLVDEGCLKFHPNRSVRGVLLVEEEPA